MEASRIKKARQSNRLISEVKIMDEDKGRHDNMLPRASANFTLPSLYDNLELDCRLYFPRLKSDHGTLLARGIAIFAHPYAPLGGCYDDPVVNSVGGVLLRQGYLLVTFNFRGADQSPGKTSWSGRGELGDFVSVYAFCLSMINVSGVLEHLSQGPTDESTPTAERRPVLLLGGYSYGSMIAAHLPSIDVVGDCLLNATDGSAEREIENRAHELGTAFLGYYETQQLRGRGSRKASDTATSGSGLATFGGYESSDAARKISRDRSLRKVEADRVRHSVERVRRKLSSHRSESPNSNPQGGTEIASKALPAVTVPKLRFLLISPLLGSVAGLATMFSRLKFERRGNAAARILPSTIPEEALSKNPSLVVHGSSDHFTSSTKVKAWCDTTKARPRSLLTSHEIQGAGHFWHDDSNEQKLIRTVNDWLVTIA